MKQSSIKKNFMMNVVLTMSSFIFPLITFPYASRVLLSSGTGKVSFATSIISYFSMFAQLGIPTYGIRACAQIRDNKEELTRTCHELLFINAITNVLSYLALFFALKYVPRLQNDKLLYVIISSTIFLTSIGMEWLYKALEQYTYITIRSILFKLLAMIAMFVFVRKETDYVIYGAITILASSVSNVMNLLNAHKYIGFKWIGNYNIKRHLKPIGIFFAMACATTVYTHLDVIMLGFLASDNDVGYYNAAIRIKTILVSIVTSLGQVLLPRVTYYFNNGRKEEFKTITGKALSFVFLVATPLTVYFILFASYGILFLSGRSFLGSIIPMQIIMPTVLLIGITNVLGIQILIPTGRENVVLYSEILGACVDIVINAFLIPQYASSGAAIGTLVAEFAVLLVQYFSLRNEMTEVIKSINYMDIVLATACSCLSSYWIVFLNLSNFLTLAISSTLFFLTYVLFLLWRKEPLSVEIVRHVLMMIKVSR